MGHFPDAHVQPTELRDVTKGRFVYRLHRRVGEGEFRYLTRSSFRLYSIQHEAHIEMTNEIPTCKAQERAQLLIVGRTARARARTTTVDQSQAPPQPRFLLTAILPQSRWWSEPKKKLWITKLSFSWQHAPFYNRVPTHLVSRSARANHQPSRKSSRPRKQRRFTRVPCSRTRPRARISTFLLPAPWPRAPVAPVPPTPFRPCPSTPPSKNRTKAAPTLRGPKSLAQPWRNRSTAGILGGLYA